MSLEGWFKSTDGSAWVRTVGNSYSILQLWNLVWLLTPTVFWTKEFYNTQKCAHPPNDKKTQHRLSLKSQGQFLCQIFFGTGTISRECVAHFCSKWLSASGVLFNISLFALSSPPPPALLIWMAGSDLISVKSRASKKSNRSGPEVLCLTLCAHAGFESGRQWQQVFSRPPGTLWCPIAAL